MSAVIARLVARIVVTVLVALILLAAWQWLLSGSLLDALGESAQLLFLFNDVGMGIWLVALVILAVRRRALPGLGVTMLVTIVSVVVNIVVVLIVGLVQQGWAVLMVVFAIEAGAAFLVANLVACAVVRRPALA